MLVREGYEKWAEKQNGLVSMGNVYVPKSRSR